MATHSTPLRQELHRPAKPRRVAGPLKAFVPPQNLRQALDRAVPPQRWRAIADQRGYDARAQKLTFEPYLRALLVRQLVGGNLHDLHHGMAEDPLYEGHGARLEISVPGLSKANAQRPPQPFWDVMAAVMAAVEALPRGVRIGRAQPLGATTPKQLRAIGQLLDRTQIFDARTLR